MNCNLTNINFTMWQSKLNHNLTTKLITTPHYNRNTTSVSSYLLSLARLGPVGVNSPGGRDDHSGV